MLTHKGTQTIETSRLILRRAVREDAEPMFRNWASDPEVTKFLTWPAHSSIAVSEMVIGSWLQEYEKENYYQWMIVLKELGEPIGSISVVRQNDRVEEAEIGYCIGRPWWHRGIVSEALAAVIEYLFIEVGMNRVAARHDPILTNEKYKGSALLQKTFTVDYLSKKIKVNEGEVPQYFVEESHPAIIPPEEWERVQKEFARRRSLGRKYSGNGIFATRIVCGDCGAFFGAKVWNSTSEKYRRIIWQCNDKFKGEHKCETIHLSEEDIKRRFILAFNILFDEKDEIIANCEMVARMLSDTADIDEKKAALLQELEVIAELIQKLIQENATTAQDQNEYLARYNGYVERYESAAEKLKTLEQDILVRQARADGFADFLRIFKGVESKLLDFDEKLWVLTIDKVKVMTDGTLHFIFQNGADIVA